MVSDNISSGCYREALSIIDRLQNGSHLKLLRFDLPAFGSVDLRMSDLLFIQQGYCYFKTGKFGKAINCIMKTGNSDPLLRQIRLYLAALAFDSMGNRAGAAANAGSYLLEYPEGILKAEMIGLKAEEEKSKRNFGQAAEFFVSAAENALNPEVASRFYLAAAEMYDSIGNVNKRNDYYLLSMEKSDRLFLRDSLYMALPTDDTGFMRNASLLMIKRNLHRTTLKFLREAPPDDSLIFIEGLCRMRIGHYITARRLFLSINQDSPFYDTLYPRALYYAAITAFLNRDYKSALTELTALAGSFPYHRLAATALKIVDLIKINKGEKTQEFLEYLFGIRIPDRNLELDDIMLLSEAGSAYDSGDFAKACEMYIDYQNQYESGSQWSEGYYWAYRAAALSGDTVKAREIREKLSRSDSDLFYSVLAGITPGPDLTKYDDSSGLKYGFRGADNLFYSRWIGLKQKVYNSYPSKIMSGNTTLGLYAICLDLGFEEISDELLYKIPQSAITDLPDAISLLNYLLVKGRYDEFYQIIHAERDLISSDPDAAFLLYPPLYEQEIVSSAVDAGVDPFLVWAIVKNESLFDSDVESYAGAIGLMQLMPRTARRTAHMLRLHLLDPSELENPEKNIKIGVAYLAALIRRYDGNLLRALAAYNAGPGNLSRWLRKTRDEPDPYFLDRYAFSQTRHYVKAVINDYLHYRRIWGEDYAQFPPGDESVYPAFELVRQVGN